LLDEDDDISASTGSKKVFVSNSLHIFRVFSENGFIVNRQDARFSRLVGVRSGLGLTRGCSDDANKAE